MGFPVEHSLSPAMHNAAFRRLGLDYCYVAFSVRPDGLEDAIRGVRALGLRGVNVTVPHKERVVPLLDEVDDEAALIGAVNTVVNDQGVLRGFNTDGRGFMQSLAEAGIAAAGKRALLIGAGGAARAVGASLCREASEVILYNRDRARAASLRDRLSALKGNVSVVDGSALADGAFLSSVDIIINATPLGLSPGDPLPLEPSLLSARHAVCDLLYKETPLLRAAAQQGCRTLDGRGMLLWQGAYAFELWTGTQPPVEVMRETLLLSNG